MCITSDSTISSLGNMDVYLWECGCNNSIYKGEKL